MKSKVKGKVTLREFLAWLDGFKREHYDFLDIPVYDALSEVEKWAKRIKSIE